MNEQVKVLNISNDKVFVNGNNSWIKFFDLSHDNTFCSLHIVEIDTPSKLDWLSALVNSTHKNFKAKNALILTWMAIGSNKCDGSNFFQVILTTDHVYNLVLFNYLKNNYNSTRDFYIGVKSKNDSELILTNHSQLISNSNVGINGKWIFTVNEKNSSSAHSQQLNIFFIVFVYILLTNIY